MSPRLSKVPRRLLPLRMLRDKRVCRAAVPRIDAPNSTPVGASTAATLATAAALRGERSGQAVQHTIERGGVERSVQRQRLADVGLNGCDLQVLQPPGRMSKHMHVGIEESDRAAVGDACSCQEIASPRPNVEVSVAEVPPILLHQLSRRAVPHVRREEAEDHGVIDLEEERGVFTLARVGGVVTLH